MPANAATIVLASFLLFLLQPLIGRYLLPLYGGAPAVWTMALLFFQAALLAGYGYAHLLCKLRPRLQAVVHGVLVLAGLAFLPVTPDVQFAPSGGSPELEILWLLTRTIGLPFVVLAATSPLLQSWLSSEPSVFRLYALSNVGSLLALLAYPFALEPWIGRDLQAYAWSAGYAAFALAAIVVAARHGTSKQASPSPAASLVTAGRCAVWFALAACGVWMLMAVTNEMSVNIAPTPFLWVVPLALYLLSYVVAFSSERFTRRKFTLPALLLACLMLPLAASSVGEFGIVPRIALFAGALLMACTALHAEAYRLRPDASRLTGFYLCLAAGGAAGGLFVGVVAPRVFPLYWEFEIGQVLCVLAVLAAMALDPSSRLARLRPRWAWVCIVLALLAWGDQQQVSLRRELADTLDSRRSFFGVSRVTQSAGERRLIHGTTNHGAQFLDERRGQPGTYFSPASGVGQTLAARARSWRVGVVGLGVGTLAAYGRAGDVFRFYELDPGVHELAMAHFTYLADSAASIEVAIGDGRLLLASEDAQHFNLLVLDAFSSDAVPVHLLTREAFEIYARHVAPGGVIAVNITNHHLDLRPIVIAAARERGWHWKWIVSEADAASAALYAEWMILGVDEATMPPGQLDPDTRELPAWTDDFSNLFRILK